MNNLIKINQTENGMQVDARELHQFLEVGRDFTNWIKGRIEKYGFVEGEDFTPILAKSTGGRPAIEYSLTIDMAKELCMVENNEKGREARRYFIECEKRIKRLIPATQDFLADKINAHFLIADKIARISGVHTGIAYAHALTAIQKDTGLDITEHTKALPAAKHDTGYLTASALGMKIGGKSAVAINKKLSELGLQFQEVIERTSKKTGKSKTEKQWRLTEEGKKYGEEYPYNRNGHAGYQIKWNEAAVALLEEKMQ